MRATIFTAALAVSACAGGAERHRHARMLSELHDEERADSAAARAAAFTGAEVLDRDALIAAVLARNPGVAAARAAWRAAVVEYPTMTGLMDPMVRYELAPASLFDGHVGQRIAVAQQLPVPGARRLAGRAALADAAVMAGEYGEVRLAVALAASDLYDDYFVIARSLTVNATHRALIERMRASAESRYAVGRGSAQDPLQAEVELGMLAQDEAMLAGEQAMVIARLNALLHRAPAAALPPPPAELTLPPDQPDDEVDDGAGAGGAEPAAPRRPMADAARARVESGEVAIATARQAFRPAVELMASYDSMPAMAADRWMIGVEVELPLARAARHARVDAARARAAGARAELDRVLDDTRLELAEARAAARAGRATIAIQQQRLLPAARQQVEAALAGFVTGANDFATVITAERGLRAVELDAARAQAELHRRLAAVDRALGRVPGQGGAVSP